MWIKRSDVEPSIGKLTINLKYSNTEVVNSEGSEVRGSEMLMEKETRIQRMLPKQGTLSIELMSKKIRYFFKKNKFLLFRKIIYIFNFIRP